MGFISVLLLLPAVVFSLNSPVAWQPSSLIQTSTVAVISTGIPALFTGINNFTVIFAQSFLVVPTVGIVLTKVTQTTPSPVMAIYITGILPQQSSVNLTLDFKTGNTFSQVSVGFIAIDYSIEYVTYSSGYIVDSDYVPYSNSVNASHSLNIIGYLTGFSIDTTALGPGGNFNVNINVGLYNSSCCFVNKTQANLTFYLNYATSVGILLVDLTLAQTEKTHYFDFDPVFESLGVSIIHSTYVYSGISTLFAGINGFNIPNGQYFSFSFDPISLQLSSSSTFTSLRVGICNIRFRSCPIGIPQFMESNLTCNDSCPVSYYSFPTFSYCAPCDYSCLTCSGPVVCNTCQFASNRHLQVTGTTSGVDFGMCVCNDYYYDDLSNRLCKACHPSCQSCEDSSQTSCLVCNEADSRFLNPLRTVDPSLHTLVGQCSCGPGYYNNGTSICPKCHYSCLTCVDQSVCLTCPDNRIHDPDSNSCVCKIGFADYGNPVCEKQYNFRLASSVLYLSLIGSLFFFVVDRFKIQHIETIWIFQLVFFTSSILGTDSAYSPFTTLSPIVNGYNRLSNAQFNTISSSVPLQALGIRSIFIGNANIMPAFALGVFSLGFLIWVINKVLIIIPDMFMTMSQYCMHDGVFSIVLFNTLNVFFSFGVQIDSYIQMTQATLSSIVLNWIYIIILCLLQGWVFYRYLVDYKNFGVMNQALKKDPLSLRHPLVMGLTRTIEGFSLGIGYQWKIIPLEILAIQLIVIVYMILKKPYKSKLDMTLAVTNQVIILIIVLLMAMQSQGMFLDPPQRWLVSWVQTGLALLALVKSGGIFYFKTYKNYMSKKHDRMPQVKLEGLTNTQNMIGTSHNLNDSYSGVENEEVVGIKKRKDTI